MQLKTAVDALKLIGKAWCIFMLQLINWSDRQQCIIKNWDNKIISDTNNKPPQTNSNHKWNSLTLFKILNYARRWQSASHRDKCLNNIPCITWCIICEKILFPCVTVKCFRIICFPWNSATQTSDAFDIRKTSFAKTIMSYFNRIHLFRSNYKYS